MTTEGVGVERARLSVVDSEIVEFTAADGAFVLDCALPCVLLVEHPRFRETALEATAAEASLEIVLEAKQEVFESIDVTAQRGGGAMAPISIAATAINPEEQAVAPATLVELLQSAAGVAENGQPGLFQVYAIRGVSRQRVLTFVDGAPIEGERRAGVSVSFVDPLLLGEVEVVRGPASTHYGSRALGGVVQLFPRRAQALRVEGGYRSFGDEHALSLAWGDDRWSLAVARRAASEDAVADGSPQNTDFEQVSATISRRWSGSSGVEWRLGLVPSYGSDLGKPNLDFPDDRITDYPRERHLVATLSADGDDWTARAYAHPNSLTTDVLRPGQRRNVVENEAFDFGFSGERRVAVGDGVWTFGGDLFARRGVEAIDVETPVDGGPTTTLRSLDGSQEEIAAFASVRQGFGATTLLAGSRYTHQRQDNIGFDATDDGAFSGFLGLVRPLGAGVELVANVATGLRFASLTERYFIGTTGRGQVIGNPDLEAERSLSLELGARWFGAKSFVEVRAFRLEIDDYIERIEVADELLTFVNLTSGTIDGLELEAFHRVGDRWKFDLSGHLLDGEADDGSPLADISPDRLQLGVEYRAAAWRGRVRYQHRAAKNDPGPGEFAIGSADLITAAVAVPIGPELEVTLRGENLLDETYRASADDLSSFAPGRSWGLSFVWTPGR
ncbi:MAG: TonB-dependent receptor [Acidobacteriota bacterium]